MRAYFILFCLLFVSWSGWAQMYPKQVEIFKEKVGGIYKVYARNTNYCPVSVFFTYTGENTCGIPSKRVLVAAQAEKQLLLTISPCNTKKAYNFNYKYTYWLGDTDLATYEKDFTYMLPYSEGQAFYVMQGYFGTYSHQGERSIDFKTPEGTKIVAIREGVVILTKQDSNRGGPSSSYANDGNYILIYHKDGTFATYYHFKQNGVVVNEGNYVKQGQHIGYSGNTGWSSEPHLHINVCSYKPNANDKNMFTYSTNFLVSGNKKVVLEQGKTYTSVKP